MEAKTVEAYECKKCGALHRIGGMTYIKILGDFFIGENEKIVSEKECAIYCKECFKNAVLQIPTIVFNTGF